MDGRETATVFWIESGAEHLSSATNPNFQERNTGINIVFLIEPNARIKGIQNRQTMPDVRLIKVNQLKTVVNIPAI